MTYQLGIDLGTTYTAASIGRAGQRTPDVVTLGARSATVASVMYLADDGSVLVGESAERRALTDPDRVVREFKRRIGDEIPLLIGSRQYQAHELGARMTRWVVDLVSEREGGPPRRIAVTHPAAWGAHKKDLLGRALHDVGLSVTFLAEPQAAAVSYASAERVDVGSTIAVYDLGGGTFDAAVVRKTQNGGFELLGQPEGLERLGGVDFDEAVFSHVRESLGGQLEGLDPEDPDVLTAVARLRRECVEAKEALSSDTEATIPVLLPNLRSQSRITRGEFEAMIRPALEETILALRRAINSAGLTPADLSAVLLVGGSSRIPLVSQLVSDELGRPVAVDADPKTAIAMGAALAISPQPPPQPGPPPGVQGSGGLRPSQAGVGAAGAIGGAAFRSGPPPASGGQSAGGQGGPPPPPQRPEPQRPSIAEPQRPDVAPAAFADGGHEGEQYAEQSKPKQNGMLIGVGAVVAIGAILAAIFLWPKSSDTPDNTSNTLTPETSAPATTSAPEPAKHTTPKPKPKPPAATTHNQTTTVTKPPSTSTTPSTPKTTPTTPKTTPNNSGGEDNAPSTANGAPGGTGGASGSTGDDATNNSLPSDQGAAPTPQATPSTLDTPQSEYGYSYDSPGAGVASTAPPVGQSWRNHSQPITRPVA
ncbi:hypothetical protein GCM10023321_02440 [Pseudonocardia eucalypti]|uniref:Hsp70 protein n=1 Tax=Pseudonocardia eucalypti TaxID=648755 RepID=A0ABP9PG13_9PSEU|nr:actin-like ATPase involved in cell morphogenesis [Pseudonocardia eucalypti]